MPTPRQTGFSSHSPTAIAPKIRAPNHVDPASTPALDAAVSTLSPSARLAAKPNTKPAPLIAFEVALTAGSLPRSMSARRPGLPFQNPLRVDPCDLSSAV